ncbi:Fcf2 pre-rRNA processing-domain-containing protein [Lineolata rhizophorae]|uniref:Fcf2 pre-rRNA processing-domain-containing protein n=1 Tax=Lineolata rhizophorae TaxID=578093 RepID=A0A6A6NYV7_9PEZI|nr:Fcf2 pre-rRNA processing-domain-containing protein [Lineolata rhizophorae]
MRGKWTLDPGELEELRRLYSDAAESVRQDITTSSRGELAPLASSAVMGAPPPLPPLIRRYLDMDVSRRATKRTQEPKTSSDLRLRKVEDPVAAKKRRQREKHATAGPDWFNLPRTEQTEEAKRDFQLLKMRSVLDPHRHYKKESAKAEMPKYSQRGTLIEGPAEYYTARIPNKERKRTFVEEVLAKEAESGKFKEKFEALQATKRSGKKEHYKALRAKRASNFKRS